MANEETSAIPDSRCLTAKKLGAEFARFIRVGSAKIDKSPCADVSGVMQDRDSAAISRIPRRPSTESGMRRSKSHYRAVPLRAADLEELMDSLKVKPGLDRCRPRLLKLEVPSVTPGTNERVPVDVAYLQDNPDRLAALRECIEIMFGSSTDIYRKLDTNGSGIVTPSELESGLNSLRIPWQQVTGLTRAQLHALVDRDKSGSVEILDFLGKMALTARPDWALMSLTEQWEQYCNKVIELDLTNLVSNPPLWTEPQEVTAKLDAMEKASRRKLSHLIRNSSIDLKLLHTKFAGDPGGGAPCSMSREDSDFIQTRIVKIEKFLKDFNENKRELVKIRMDLAGITESQERAAELKRKREEEEREKQRIKTQAGMALVSGENGKISIFGKKSNSVIFSQFAEPREDELGNFFSLSNPSLLSQDEIQFRQLLRGLGLSAIEGDKIKGVYAKHCSGDMMSQDQFNAVMRDLLKIAPELVPVSRFHGYWISAACGKDHIAFSDFITWYSNFS